MPAVARGELDRGIMDEKTSRALLAARSPPLTRPPRYQVALGNALRSEASLHMEGVSAGGSGCAPELKIRGVPCGGGSAVQLPEQVRSQVQLGNEGADTPLGSSTSSRALSSP